MQKTSANSSDSQNKALGAFDGKSGLVLVTGVSGAGRTTTLKILEDFGFDAVDNLPLRMLSALVPGIAARNSRLPSALISGPVISVLISLSRLSVACANRPAWIR